MIKFILKNINMRFLKTVSFIILLNFILFFQIVAGKYGLNANEYASEQDLATMKLVEAVVCENIKDFAPENPAVVFPVSIGRVSCFTAFESVAENTFIFHRWYHRDKLITTFRLEIKPPKWATRSSIQLRETDKGPWRVEILDSSEKIIGLLRFSITD